MFALENTRGTVKENSDTNFIKVLKLIIYEIPKSSHEFLLSKSAMKSGAEAEILYQLSSGWWNIQKIKQTELSIAIPGYTLPPYKTYRTLVGITRHGKYLQDIVTNGRMLRLRVGGWQLWNFKEARVGLSQCRPRFQLKECKVILNWRTISCINKYQS